ncbi:D-2-hydroxyacid dehydrogenase [Pseudomonas aeruginosa]|uniref:D-2-hydroxyacid dehydrogenase n=1 Tax=Pseudomonas aeruginosa TaxID=287 RepID=UPI0003512D65|nr:D-2-hydroxyacid dehydrogenase [Pseudomonas aeruginosa]HCL2778607.1 D-2-hydroxyacid dehydrogenase [Pseudomonas aeruginosa AC9A]AGO39142.1 2-hydroxyacid dehydrogenase [Pseudomonas aeruginosa RP73]AHC78226.1 D-3-phosphoglycerate dehydrogenase [Pseudomonas aeruginosa SCV20265]ALY46756.1 hydroxyacid dehydrogenase [Pseudomonas aeruginosa]EKQ5878708.1 D-2-hydroxyacid dehydrogenase [Pseudomonas aeruginosa]
MRLLILERDHALYAALLMAADPSLKVVAGGDPLQLIDAASECSIWLGQPDLVAQMLRQGVHPVWVQSTWAGITPLLAADLPKDYSLTRAVGIFGQVMSEYLLTYMLAHERQFLGRLASQVGSQWDSRTPGGLRGRQVVIVGTGEIGQAVAHTLSGFGMDLTGVAKNPRSLVPFNRMGSLDDLGRLVETADYLINLLPDTPDTHDIYDRALFARLKPTALFINAGRGVAVVDADLVAALENNQLAGAVIDVCREEPLPANHLFWHTPRLLLTGHTAAPTLPGAMVELFRDNLARFWAGTAMRGEVDFARGY